MTVTNLAVCHESISLRIYARSFLEGKRWSDRLSRIMQTYTAGLYHAVSVPDPKPTPAQITFILEVIYASDEVRGRDHI